MTPSVVGQQAPIKPNLAHFTFAEHAEDPEACVVVVVVVFNGAEPPPDIGGGTEEDDSDLVVANGFSPLFLDGLLTASLPPPPLPPPAVRGPP